MQAFQINRYSSRDLKMTRTELTQPSLQKGEVRIQVKASGVNPLDKMILRGEVKLITPYRLPLTLGNECSGIITQIGQDVTDFAVGDHVFTRLPIGQIGAFADEVTVPATAVAKMPLSLNFIEAASIPLTALTAYQALDLLEAKAGQTIFISGGSGGLGAMAIPLAKVRGLIVYTSGNAASRERVLALGADRYLDYRQEDYLTALPPVDFVLDSLGGDELLRQMRLVKAGGKIVSLRGIPNGSFARRFGLPRWKQLLLSLASFGIERAARKQGIRYEFLFVESNGEQLAEIARLIDEQGIRPSVDKVFPFADANEALAQLARGGSSGKIVLSHA